MSEAGSRDVRSLGMSVAYGIMKSYDGWMDVESDPSTGNTFSIYLPAFDGPGSGVRPSAAAHAPPVESRPGPAPAPEAEAEAGPPQRTPPGERERGRHAQADRSLMPESRSQSMPVDRKARGRGSFGSGDSTPAQAPSGPERGATPPTDAEATLGGTETVFVVDAVRGDLDLAHVFLTKFHYKVLVASESQQALQAFRFIKDEVRLAVIDLGMPEMDGLSLYAELRRIGPQLRVVFTAKNSTDASLRQEAAYQGYTLMRKPFTEDALARAVRKSLDAP
jgi:CheY-like chemotaxis protein